MIALGALAVTSAAVIDEGTISEKTFASRTRRAINCAYCAPKSRTSTGLATVNKYLDALEFLYIGISASSHCAAKSAE